MGVGAQRIVGVAALAFALVVGALAAPGAQASVSCKFNPVSHVLEVDPYEDRRVEDLDFAAAVVRRSGSRILVLNSKSDSAREAIACHGPRATVRNTDTVDILERELSFVQLDLSGGMLAPGFTPEADGSNEIEVRFGTDIQALGFGTVVGTPGDDDWRFLTSGSSLGLSLDPARPTEADVTYDGLGTSVAVAETGDGDDRVDASGVAKRIGLLILEGGAGADTLLGSPFKDALQGDSGRDVLESGGGPDMIDSSDSTRDQVDCGPGKDEARIGKGDHPVGCEKVERSRRLVPPGGSKHLSLKMARAESITVP